MKEGVHNWFRRPLVRKLLAAVVVLALVAAGAVWWMNKKNAQAPILTNRIRTTRLQKTSLNESVIADGTIQSSNTSTVTTDQKYAVKEILVNVGDTVQEGDVICILDTTELEDSIAKLQNNLADETATANSQVNNANTQLTSATDDALAQESVLTDAQNALAALESSWQAAQAAVAPYLQNYATAQNVLQQRGVTLTTLQAQGASEEIIATAQADYDAANEAAKQSQQQLEQAKQQCNYESLQQQYQQAQQTYSQARQQLDQLESAVEQAGEQLETSQKNAEKAGESDELEQLQSQLEKCTLRATTSGKITQINATVGSAVNGSAAVIQDTGALELAITIPEYDIADVQVGMQVKITTDSTDKEIAGTLSQISPVAGENGFDAVVSIADSTGLYIGTNATSEIVQSTIDDVFVVPIDAVEEQEDGSQVIYLASTDENGEQTFSPIPVTLGSQNDYYVEVSGDQLQEGMEIRASVLEEEQQASQQMEMMPGGMMGGGMQGGRPSEMGSTTVVIGSDEERPERPTKGGGAQG